MIDLSSHRPNRLLRWQLITVAITLTASAVLIFARLGHYPLWDDEANTALIGQSVWRTGDTVAKIGQNIIAFRGGGDLVNLRTRYIPPGQFYLAAPFVGGLAQNQPNTFLARLPFALFGVVCVVLMLVFLKCATDDPIIWLVACIAILCNVSLILYCRQCRYYSMAICATIAIILLYHFWTGRWWSIALFVLASLILLASNYLNFAALYLCLLVDYLIWGRRRHRIAWRQLLAIVVPQILIGGIIVGIWNPLGKEVTGVAERETLGQKLTLLWWNFRDMNMAEFFSVPLMLVGLVLFLSTGRGRRASILLRAPVAVLIYAALVTIASPQKLVTSYVADVRYLTPLIPICLAAAVVTIAILSAGRIWLAAILAAVVFGTNVSNGGSLSFFNVREPPPVTFAGVSSSTASYVMELAAPPQEPYTPTIEWLKTHAAPGSSVVCIYDFNAYTLMYYAPQFIYAWQLSWPPQEQFKSLPLIHFFAQQVPDYIIVFGPPRADFEKNSRFPPEYRCTMQDCLHVYFRQLYRPELFWRVFRTMPITDPQTQQIYIYHCQRVEPEQGKPLLRL